MCTGTRVLALTVIGACLTCSCSAAAAEEPAVLDARVIRAAVRRELMALPSLVRWVDFPDTAGAGLAFEAGPQKGTLQAVAGKWPEQRAAHIFYGLLRGDPIHPPEAGFTVAFWLRVRDVGP